MFNKIWEIVYFAEGSWSDRGVVAIKMPKPNTMESMEFLREAMTMKALRHKRLVGTF